MARSCLLIFAPLLLLAVCCTTSKPGNSPGSNGGGSGSNNVVTTISKNSRYSSSKTDGASTLIFKGSNNIISIDITDSDIASYNTKTVTIIEGDNNNLTSTTRKCVLIYKGRSDTLIIKGNQLKIDFTADNITALIEPTGGKEVITTGQDLSKFNWAEWKSADEKIAAELVYVEPLGKNLLLPQAFAYYSEQARNGNYQSFYMLGRFFDNITFDTKADIPKAIEYYEMAARHNNVEAALRLARIYEVGDFEFEKATVDRLKAQYYYGLAAKNGSEPAREKLATWGR